MNVEGTDMGTRDTYRYILRQGHRTVYVGITDDPGRREGEHSADKVFDRMAIQGPRVTRGTAEKWELDAIDRYKSGHSGHGPKYNKT